MKYLFLVPVVTAMLLYSSCESDIVESKKNDFNIDNQNIIEQLRSLQIYNDKELTIREIVKEDRNLGPGDFILVGDVGNLNENEINQIQRKIQMSILAIDSYIYQTTKTLS